MIVEEGPSGWVDPVVMERYLQVTTSVSSGAKTGSTAQLYSSASSLLASMSDQNAGKIGPVVGEWNPERAARMCSEW